MHADVGPDGHGALLAQCASWSEALSLAVGLADRTILANQLHGMSTVQLAKLAARLPARRCRLDSDRNRPIGAPDAST